MSQRRSRCAFAVRSRNEVLSLVADFDRQVSQLRFADVILGALQFFGERLHLARASIALTRAEGDGFLIFNVTTPITGMEPGRIIPHGSATLSETVTERRAIYRPDIRLCPKTNEVDKMLEKAGLICTLSIPLLTGNLCLGSLNVASRTPDGLEEPARQVLEFLAPRLAHAIQMGSALDALAASETRFREVFDTVGDGILAVDSETHQLLFVNSTMCNLLDHDREDALTLNLDALCPSGQEAEHRGLFEGMVRGDVEQALELGLRRRDGTVIQTDVSVKRTVLSNRHCVIGVFRDASVRQQRQSEQLQLQKLESIRTLAAGIAHDFNNFLTGLLGTVALAQSELAPEHPAWELLAEADRCAIRATSLTRQLLTFAKGGSPVCARIALNQLIQDTARLATSGTNVSCIFQLPREQIWVLGDEGQLSQAVQNLVRNAAEAMPGGGNIWVSLSCPEGNGEREACLEVRDEGAGIAPELLEKVFVPFYTTKKSGSGLGLAVAWSIVQNHGGRLTLASTVKHGTTVSMVLPVACTAGGPSVTTPTATLPPKTGRLLIMDDQPLVLCVAERALREAGYEVVTAEDGTEAIEAYRTALSEGTRFDGVVLDLTIPGGIGGQEVAKQILSFDSKARLMASSGYSDDLVMSDYSHYGFMAALPKPYGVKQLCRAVSELLTRPLDGTQF